MKAKVQPRDIEEAERLLPNWPPELRPAFAQALANARAEIPSDVTIDIPSLDRERADGFARGYEKARGDALLCFLTGDLNDVHRAIEALSQAKDKE